MAQDVQPHALADDGLGSAHEEHSAHHPLLPDIEILVDNKLLLDQLGAIKGRIRASLAAGLHNGSITVSLRLAKQNEIKPVLTKKQIFDKMKKDYKPFALLVDGLGLELG